MFFINSRKKTLKVERTIKNPLFILIHWNARNESFNLEKFQLFKNYHKKRTRVKCLTIKPLKIFTFSTSFLMHRAVKSEIVNNFIYELIYRAKIYIFENALDKWIQWHMSHVNICQKYIFPPYGGQFIFMSRT